MNTAGEAELAQYKAMSVPAAAVESMDF